MKKKLTNVTSVFLICLTVLSQYGCKSGKTVQNDTEKEFISLAYVSLSMLKLHKANPEEIKAILDNYRWDGISDIVLIGGIYMTGKEGSIITSWNRSEWPEVFEGVDYLDRPINEKHKRNMLCSKEVVNAVVDYFKQKDMKLWLSQTAAGWLTGGSFGVVLEDKGMTKEYALKLYRFAKDFGCVGVDFDWEFPPNKIQAEGYRDLMKQVKDLGMKVSVCAIRPTAGKEYLDQAIEPEANINGHAGKFMKWEEIINDQMVDYINVMQYLGYNPKTKQLDVNIKAEKMAEWEKIYPNEFTENRNIDFLCGIGYYSFLLPEFKKNGKKGGKNLQFIYDNYGAEALGKKVVEGHAIWSTSDVSEIVKYAKKQGWSGVFTWLVSHDVTNEVDDEYSRQRALANEVEKIWEAE
ncbi:glycoside hydrolase family 18 protein [Tamlana sp. 2201CG12-4]|uniref:glycoside hydrolase family 18 protein n=1 Tax=Tamlana sp. 2201CG12-4 TaxID=3112582 RepID=UPI002DBEBD28|nr:glycoside hydrolase family 18 protein [Tamlana sp. 2201CG12-4]MEC3907219.1 glycoside hydrolase family 18 protein [Tamlana sp. 2201CG12-4]